MTFSLSKNGENWFLRESGEIPAGYISKSWPFLLVGTQLTRTQKALLGDDEIQIPPKSFDFMRFPLAPAPQFGKPKPKPKRPKCHPKNVGWMVWILGSAPSTTPKSRRANSRWRFSKRLTNLATICACRSPLKTAIAIYLAATIMAAARNHARAAIAAENGQKARQIARKFAISYHHKAPALGNDGSPNARQRQHLQDGGEFQTQFSGLKKDAVGNGDWGLILTAQSRGDHLRRLWNTRDLQSFLFSGWKMSLTDDKGQNFRIFPGGGRFSLSLGANQPPRPLSPDRSPLPPDIPTGNMKARRDFPLQRHEISAPARPKSRWGSRSNSASITPPSSAKS